MRWQRGYSEEGMPRREPEEKECQKRTKREEKLSRKAMETAAMKPLQQKSRMLFQLLFNRGCYLSFSGLKKYEKFEAYPRRITKSYVKLYLLEDFPFKNLMTFVGCLG
ncbi:MAG: hypothetical protein WBG63_10915 [Phormidesmis sp.]